MSYDFYMRPALNVETYDLRTDTGPDSPLHGDVDFFLTLAQQTGGPALELGPGTGRVTWPLAEAGIEVRGLELSPAMIAAAERKGPAYPKDVRERARFVQGDMADFDLGMEFGLVFAAARVFQALLRPEDQRRCLACARRHLRSDGLLALDLFDPRLEWLAVDHAAPHERPDVRHPETGNLVRTRITRRQVDPFTQTFNETWNFQELDGAGAVLREERETLVLRWTYRQEMRYLLELSGFEIAAEYGDFHGGPPRYAAEQVWVARPAA